MLRLIVLILLLANAGYYAWSQGLLGAWGFAPVQQAEPHRLAQQLRPEAVRLLNPEEARRLESASSTASSVRAPECLVAGPLEDGAATAVRAVLEAWPANSWSAR